MTINNYYIVTVERLEDGSSVIKPLTPIGFPSYEDAREAFSDAVGSCGLEEDACTIICDMQPEKEIEIKSPYFVDKGIDTREGVHYVRVTDVGDGHPPEVAEKLLLGIHQTYGVILPDIVAVAAPSGIVFSEEDMNLFEQEGCEPYLVLVKDHGDDWEIFERPLH